MPWLRSALLATLVSAFCRSVLASAAAPEKASLVENAWVYCARGSGARNFTVWPNDDHDRLQAVEIPASGIEWIHWLEPVQSVAFACDGMQIAGTMKFATAKEWWSVAFALPEASTAEDRLQVRLSIHDVSTSAQPRSLVARNGHFVDNATGKVVFLTGANVVMKGPPWFPSTDGETICADRWFTNFTCYTFNKYDAMNLKNKGHNFIRLGVVWAGGQPTEEPQLDPEWLERFYAVLNITRDYGLYVVLDVHQDAVGTATCGEGVPQWFSAKATPDHIGKPLQPIAKDWPVKWPIQADGLCMTNDTVTWALHKGEVDYNVKNPCCRRYNGGGESWGRLIDTWQAQETLHYLFQANEGRGYYAKYLGMLAKAVRNYPNVIGIETMNEPPSIERWSMFATWQAAYDAIRAEVPDMAVSVQDTGQSPLDLYDLGLWPSQIYWLHRAKNLFYAFHWYSYPKSPKDGIANAVSMAKYWGMPALMTEMNNCDVVPYTKAAGIGYSWWEYANYCDIGSNRPRGLPDGNFGACITGVDGNANFTCPSAKVEFV